jgi:hypothetical protein
MSLREADRPGDGRTLQHERNPSHHPIRVVAFLFSGMVIAA